MTVQHIDGEKEAVIFDIQHFSVNDGPGIRTNVFFKGCPLRCQWCHNPESYRMGQQLSFIASACVGCMDCVKVCPNGVNEPVITDGKLHLQIHYDKCKCCGKCLEVCCYDARSIIGKRATVEDIVAEVEKDKPYYAIGKDGKKGGVTLTGGEPMNQFPFVSRLVDALRADDIDVCMETCGYGKTEDYATLVDRIDYFLFDYKVTGRERHKELCGVYNDLILKNLDFLCSHGAHIILRLPMIPGLNDTEEHFKRITELVNENPAIDHAEIMAYHNLGVAKAKNVGMEGDVLDQESATKEQKQIWMERFAKLGLTKIKIG